MAERTYTTRALVLRKTKLGETDLIVTMLSEQGSIVRAVAKGARKPRSSFAANLDLYCVADVQCACGKNLDIVKEARRIQGASRAVWGLEQSLCAAPVAELVGAIAQENLEMPRLFDMTCAALERIASATPEQAALFSSAALLKALAFAGVRPSLSECIVCGKPIDAGTAEYVPFSFLDGGAVCASCEAPSDTIKIEANTLGWCAALLYSTFDDISSLNCDLASAFSCLDLVGRFAQVHLGIRLKSLRVLFESGLF